jgi:hypothetical protein
MDPMGKAGKKNTTTFEQEPALEEARTLLRLLYPEGFWLGVNLGGNKNAHHYLSPLLDEDWNITKIGRPSDPHRDAAIVAVLARLVVKYKIPLTLRRESPLTDAEVKLLDARKSGSRTGQNILDDHQAIDPALHRPGFRIADQSTRDSVSSARSELIDRSVEAWRGKVGGISSTFDTRTDPPGGREAWVQGLRDAWKRPATHAPSPDRTSGLARDNAGPFLRDEVSCGPGPARTLPPNGADDNPQALREAAYAEYAATITNAWKSAPPSAAMIERERKRMTVETK